MKTKILFVLISSFFLIQFICAQEFYVDAQKGNDSNKGVLNEPFQTIDKAVQVANELTGQGSISIKLMPGLYVLKDKISLNPVRVFQDTTRFCIEAYVMPGDSVWTPEKMPVVQSISRNNSNTQFPHATGFLFSSNNITVKGIKFIGNPNPDVTYYYPITRENPSLKGMEVSQCYFIAERNSTAIQGGVWAQGQGITITHCVFTQCRNAILLFRNINVCRITNNIIYDADESAFWIGENNKDFEFSNNVISRCQFFWTNSSGSAQTYPLSNSVITENKHYLGKWDNGKHEVVEMKENTFVEKNIVKKGEVTLINRTSEKFPRRYLHLTPESIGYNLQAGLFSGIL